MDGLMPQERRLKVRNQGKLVQNLMVVFAEILSLHSQHAQYSLAR